MLSALLLTHSVSAYSPGVAPLALRSSAAATAARPSQIVMADDYATIVFLRHGQSVWNEASLFTGWADVELTTLGKNEAASAATNMCAPPNGGLGRRPFM